MGFGNPRVPFPHFVEFLACENGGKIGANRLIGDWFLAERESDVFKGEPIQCFRGIDVNRMPTMTELDDGEEEEGAATASSPTSTVSSLSLSGTKRGADIDLLEEERASSRGGGGGAGAGSGASDEEDTSRKKLRLSKDQSAVLEESFKEHPTLNPVLLPPSFVFLCFLT